MDFTPTVRRTPDALVLRSPRGARRWIRTVHHERVASQVCFSHAQNNGLLLHRVTEIGLMNQTMRRNLLATGRYLILQSRLRPGRTGMKPQLSLCALVQEL